MSAAGAALDLDAFCVRYLAAWNGHDLAAMADLVTEDVAWADPALPGGSARGVAALQEFMRDAFRAFPDLRLDEPDPPHRAAHGDRVAWAWRMRGTMRGAIEPPGFAPNGRSMDVDGVDLWTMRDGRIAGCRAFYDLNAVAVQLGLAPAPGSRAERATVALQRLQMRVANRRRKS